LVDHFVLQKSSKVDLTYENQFTERTFSNQLKRFSSDHFPFKFYRWNLMDVSHHSWQNLKLCLVDAAIVGKPPL
jgi:hypothetical protein